MQFSVDSFRQVVADAFDPGQFFHTRVHHAAQAAEGLQQLLAAFGADSADAFQARLGARLAAARPVAGISALATYGALRAPTAATPNPPMSQR